MPVVLVHGRSVPGAVAFDLESGTGGGHYSLARELAQGPGLDVWVVELQGMGRSTHPDEMDAKHNADPLGRQRLDVPATKPRDMPFGAEQLTNSDSDMDELDEVIHHIMNDADLVGIPVGTKVHLLGYSAGAFRGRTIRAQVPREPGLAGADCADVRP